MTLTASQASTRTYGAEAARKKQLEQLQRVITDTMTSNIWTELFVDNDGQPDLMSWGTNFAARHAAESALAHIHSPLALQQVMNTFDCRPMETGRFFLVLLSMNLDPPAGLVRHPEAYALSVATIMARMYTLRHGITLS